MGVYGLLFGGFVFDVFKVLMTLVADEMGLIENLACFLGESDWAWFTFVHSSGRLRLMVIAPID